MAITTTLINKDILISIPKYIIVNYEFAGIASSSSSSDVLGLELPGPVTGVHRTGTPSNSLEGESYAIRPITITVSSLSTDLDIKFIEIDSIGGVGKVAQKLLLTGANLTKTFAEGVDFGRTIMMNMDSPSVNYLYLALTNNDGSNATGTVSLAMVYLCAQDRPLAS